MFIHNYTVSRDHQSALLEACSPLTFVTSSLSIMLKSSAAVSWLLSETTNTSGVAEDAGFTQRQTFQSFGSKVFFQHKGLQVTFSCWAHC